MAHTRQSQIAADGPLDDWAQLKGLFAKYEAEQSDANLEALQSEADKLVTRMLPGWPVWDVTGLIKASRVVWNTDTQPIEVETIPLDGHIDDLLPSERKSKTA
ncbi:MAG: hypothetical protein IT427_06485 [Pirellulales bacterium]|nr:hypothetical protein [Pirellulales bacterium]